MFFNAVLLLKSIDQSINVFHDFLFNVYVPLFQKNDWFPASKNASCLRKTAGIDVRNLKMFKKYSKKFMMLGRIFILI